MANDIKNKKVRPLPYDENDKPLAGIALPIVDGGGNITGWAPAATFELPDGTLALRVEAGLSVTDADIDIGDIHLLNTSDAKINPATEDKQDDAITELQNAVTEIQSILAKFTGVISTANSTSVTLGAGATFTGTAENVLGFSHLTIQVRSDQASATSGLSVEWSPDGTNWDDSDNFTVPAAKGKVFTFGPQAQYFRVIYTNGATPQTTFRLQTIKKSFYQKASSHRISDSISSDDDAELMKSVLSGETDSGSFINITASDDGFLRVISPTPEAPAGTDAVLVTVQGNVTTVSDTFIPITNGETLTLQLFSAGAEEETGGTKVELFEDPNGDLSVLNLIQALYVNGSSDSVAIGDKFVGDGTIRLVLRRSSLASSSAREVFASVRGYES